MSHLASIKSALIASGFLQRNGAYFVVDGQFGSTGKGLASGLLAEMFSNNVDLVTSNAGPNSGHTSFYKGEKVVLKQLPTFAVIAKKIGTSIPVYLNGGAVIDPSVLNEEIQKYGMASEVCVHPHASYVTSNAVETDTANVNSIGSTGKGTGPAQMAKMARKSTDAVVIGHSDELECKIGRLSIGDGIITLAEVSQGFSLGINSGFYPFTTSRECTVAQAIADAQIPIETYRDAMMVVRTFPIRVAGNSGPSYSDQIETSWDYLEVEPEITTVTKKIRRVFTWSDEQFCESVQVNRPGIVFLNFVNYLVRKNIDIDEFVREKILTNYVSVLGRMPKAILLGYGPESKDVKLWTP
jgi:adenylosuccinate synthase